MKVSAEAGLVLPVKVNAAFGGIVGFVWLLPAFSSSQLWAKAGRTMVGMSAAGA